MKNIVLLLLILSSYVVKAQNEVPELITDRPDQTESAMVVPLHSLQIETGFTVQSDKIGQTKYKSLAYNSTLLRYGLLSKFELRFGIEYLGDKVTQGNISEKTSGLGPLYTGFKIEVCDEEGNRPAIAFLGGFAFPGIAADQYQTDYTAFDMRFSLAHTLSDKLSLGYNLGAEWDGNSPAPTYIYTITLATGITEELGLFVESYGAFPEMGDQEHLLDAGLTYLLKPNLQLDFSAGIGLKNAPDNFIGIGLSYRIPQ